MFYVHRGNVPNSNRTRGMAILSVRWRTHKSALKQHHLECFSGWRIAGRVFECGFGRIRYSSELSSMPDSEFLDRALRALRIVNGHGFLVGEFLR